MLDILRQPVAFDVVDNLGIKPNYKQIVNNGDITEYQFRLTPCRGVPNLAANAAFGNSPGWTINNAGWAISGGQAAKSDTKASSLTQKILRTDRFYRIEVGIVSITNPDQLTVKLGPQQVLPAKRPEGAGEFHFFNFASGDELQIFAASGCVVTLEYVNVFEIDINYIFAVLDLDDVPQALISVLSLSPFNSLNFRISEDYITFFYDWSDVGNGCYKLAIADPCLNTIGQNGFFNNDFRLGLWSWTFDEDNSVQPDQVIVSPDNAGLFIFSPVGAIGIYERIYIWNYDLEIGKDYTLKITIGIINNFVFKWLSDITLDTYTTIGSKTVSFTATDTVLKMSFARGAAAASSSCLINSITLELDDPLADFTADLTSEAFILGDRTETLLISATNDESKTFNFNFEIFTPKLRVDAILAEQIAQGQREWSEDANGNRKVYFGDVREGEILSTAPQPQYIHRFLSLLLYFNYFYINEIPYFIEDDDYPDLQWNRPQTLAKLNLNVSRNQLLLNQNCSGADSGGVSDGSVIGTGNGLGGGNIGGSTPGQGGQFGSTLGDYDGNLLGQPS